MTRRAVDTHRKSVDWRNFPFAETLFFRAQKECGGDYVLSWWQGLIAFSACSSVSSHPFEFLGAGHRRLSRAPFRRISALAPAATRAGRHAALRGSVR